MDPQPLDFYVFPEGHLHEGEITRPDRYNPEDDLVHIRMAPSDAELLIRIQHKITTPYLKALAASVRIALDNYIEELSAEMDEEEAARFTA